MTRKVLWAVLAVGVLLIAAPFAIGLPGKASGGQQMIDDFNPLMQQADVDTTASYYNDVFVPLGDIVPAMSAENVATFQQYVDGLQGMEADAQNLVPALAQALNMTPEEVEQFLAAEFPAMAQMLQALPQMEQDLSGFVNLMDQNVEIFQQVPAGLDHYQPLVSTMQDNVGNYADVNSLPPFGWFTWFFVVPGVVLAGLAALGLVTSRRQQLTTTAKLATVPRSTGGGVRAA